MKKYLCECIDTGRISSEGPFVKEFEQKMSGIAGRGYGIAVSDRTTALDVAAQAVEIGEGDEVIAPAFTIISCAMAVTKQGQFRYWLTVIHIHGIWVLMRMWTRLRAKRKQSLRFTYMDCLRG